MYAKNVIFLRKGGREGGWVGECACACWCMDLLVLGAM